MAGTSSFNPTASSAHASHPVVRIREAGTALRRRRSQRSGSLAGRAFEAPASADRDGLICAVVTDKIDARTCRRVRGANPKRRREHRRWLRQYRRPLPPAHAESSCTEHARRPHRGGRGNHVGLIFHHQAHRRRRSSGASWRVEGLGARFHASGLELLGGKQLGIIGRGRIGRARLRREGSGVRHAGGVFAARGGGKPIRVRCRRRAAGDLGRHSPFTRR